MSPAPSARSFETPWARICTLQGRSERPHRTPEGNARSCAPVINEIGQASVQSRQLPVQIIQQRFACPCNLCCAQSMLRLRSAQRPKPFRLFLKILSCHVQRSAEALTTLRSCGAVHKRTGLSSQGRPSGRELCNAATSWMINNLVKDCFAEPYS